MKNNKLRSITKILVLAVLTLSMTSCYDDFVENEFEFTSVYLPKETIDRTFIMGEGMQIGVGVVLGGRLDNTEDVEVTFSLDESLLDPGSKLPDNYYTLVDAEGNPANNKIIIPAGKTQGFVYVKADSINFLNDPVSLGNNYALGFTLDNVVKADSILVDFKSTKITFTYINQLYGNYVQNGQVIKDDGTTAETVDYSGGITDTKELTMVSPTTLVYDGLADLSGSDKKLNVIVAADNSITIETATGGITVVDDGGSSYNPDTREIILNYSFDFNGVSYKASDVLEFRNREVDGVNQIGI
ncbi:MAG: BT_3987 domain-containing protein [Polaribacter sp.]|uniref:BT_3987 domain-containing protein n=1 Tax=Polaribacter sp. TaxID=1920175 RepID=UPI003EF4122D